MIGVELRMPGEIFVKSWRQKCSFAYISYSNKDVHEIMDMSVKIIWANLIPAKNMSHSHPNYIYSTNGAIYKDGSWFFKIN